MGIISSLVVFVVSLLVGALGIYIGARFIADADDYSYAVVSALIASLVWVIVAFFLGWIPFLGPLLALLAYIAVINTRYSGGWLDAVGIALIAWIASLVVLYVLSAVGLTAFDAVGVPGL
jgi:steroid 5-alpha reductase family enzyme